MELIILIAGFVGAWLLVAGPIFQAALELKDEDLARDRIHEVAQSITPPPEVSNWWWLLPPIKLLLEHKRSTAYRKAHFDALSREDSEAMINFIGKATGWMYVALGGFLFACKETYELTEHLGWNLGIYFAIIIGLAFASVLNTAVRMRRGHEMLAKK